MVIFIVCLSLALWMVILFAGRAEATTWSDEEIICPLCGAANTFSVVMSYGKYIYAWPSKMQFVFWPFIDPKCLYSCEECRLTLFMDDFADVPESKLETLKGILKAIAFEPRAGGYAGIPFLQRMDAAERLYEVLEKDPEFWCHFYRVKGYHLAEAGEVEAARLAREKALGLVQKMIADEQNAPMAKELFVISGAMKHMLGYDAEAMEDFKEASRLEYRKVAAVSEEKVRRALLREGKDADAKTMKEKKAYLEDNANENRKGMDEYLSIFAKEFIDILKSPGNLEIL